MSIVPKSLVDEHPCYSEGASHRYARMHLAVAPACNMQCRYCNRKFDCANESRPGVVSGVLAVDQAVARTGDALQRLPNLRVIGIAGPGDPLANQERVFTTCQWLRSRHPDLQLCLSTNGLCLPEAVGRIIDNGIRHVTITINALDEQVGSDIYSWLFWKKRRRRGKEAARILLDQQLAGMSALIAAGVMVKVNTVLIPGVNTGEVPAINQLVSEAGVFSHNVMPLISAAEHGTYYGVMGIKGPDEKELQRIRHLCRGSVRLMTHCRQCRADAAGLLAEDRHADLSPLRTDNNRVIAIHRPGGAPLLQPMVLAVASRDGDRVDTHFGHADAFWIYRVTGEEVIALGKRPVPRYCQGDDHCVEAEHPLESALKVLNDCQGVICSRIGYTPWQALVEQGITPVNSHADQPVLEALRQTAATLREQKIFPTRMASVAC